MRLYPLANAFLHICKLGWCEQRFGFVAMVLHKSLFEGCRSNRDPEIGLYVVLLYAYTIVISQTEIILSLRKALFGSLLPAAHGFGVVLRNALSTQVIECCQIRLGLYIALIGGFGVPAHGCGV